MNKATAFAPATVANVAVGFDILGFAIEGVGDQITIERTENLPQPSIQIDSIEGCEVQLPQEPHLNVATVGLLQLMKEHHLNFGFRLSIKKGIPIASGMGGSAASAVAALVAANSLLDAPLDKKALLKYALVGEALASGGSGHPDNVAPCLLGGLTLVRETDPLDILSIPVPPSILTVLVHPHLQLETRKARAALKSEITLKQHVKQSAHLAGFIVGCFRNNLELISHSLQDILIEPQRAPLIHGFLEAKQAALKAGALGVSISGSGPSVFAWVNSDSSGKKVAKALVDSFQNSGTQADAWISPINSEGAKLIL